MSLSFALTTANAHDFRIISPPELPWDEQDSLVQHLVFSMYMKELWKRGENVIEGLYARKRNERRLLTNRMLRSIVRTIRRFARFETLRSSMEGLLFEQVAFLNTPHEIPFMLKGNDIELKLTQVYFNTNPWDIYKDKSNRAKDIEFDLGTDVTEKDIAHLLLYFSMLDYMLREVRAYLLKNVRGHNFWKWKQRALRTLNALQKSVRFVTGTLLDFLKTPTQTPTQTQTQTPTQTQEELANVV